MEWPWISKKRHRQKIANVREDQKRASLEHRDREVWRALDELIPRQTEILLSEDLRKHIQEKRQYPYNPYGMFLEGFEPVSTQGIDRLIGLAAEARKQAQEAEEKRIKKAEQKQMQEKIARFRGEDSE